MPPNRCDFLFSIVTATRNDLSGLRAVFSSLSMQTFQNFEWVVIDGGSSDGSASFLNQLEPQPFGFRWISESDRGIADAWNKGINLSSGEQVLLLNAGDIYYSHALAAFADAVQSNKITCSHVQLKSELGQDLGLLRAKPYALWRGMHVPHNWASVPRTFYKKFGLYREIPYAMDYDWFLRVFKVLGASGFSVIDKPLGEYRLGGLSDTNFSESFAANARVMQENGMNPILAQLLASAYRVKHVAMRNTVRVQRLKKRYF